MLSVAFGFTFVMIPLSIDIWHMEYVDKVIWAFVIGSGRKKAGGPWREESV